MTPITTTTRQAAKVQPAQVGNGRTTHYVTAEHFAAKTLCGRTVSRVLNDQAAADMASECTRCTKVVDQRAADATPAPAAASAEETAAAPAAPRYLAEYETVQVEGRTLDRITVRSSAQDTPLVFTEFPYDPHGNAGDNLAGLGWTITGMEAYGGPNHFHAHVIPSTPAPKQVRRLMPDQARGVVITTFPEAQDFRPVHDRQGRFLGYTFQSAPTDSARFGWITNAGSYSKGLEPYRFEAELLLPSAVLEDERAAQRTDPTAERAAALAARRVEEDAATAQYRADSDDQIAAQARRYGGTLAQTTADRIADRHQTGPFKPGDRIVCADGATRTVQAMAPTVAGEPAHVIVDGGAQWIADNCRHAAEPPFHGPQGYKGPRALCGYADHIAPADVAGILADHERTAGQMGSCPGSRLAPRAHREELTRAHTTAYSYCHPRPPFLACTARKGDVVVVEGQERTVQDVHPSDPHHVLVTFMDDTAESFTLEDRLVYRRRMRSGDVLCQECGVTAPAGSNEATDGPIVGRLCGVCDHPDALDPEHRAAVLEESTARLSARAAYASAHGFQPVTAADAPRPIGWTFRTGYGHLARYGWVTALGRLIPQVGTEYRSQCEAAVTAHHEAGTLAPAGYDLVAVLGQRPVAEVRLGLEALRAVDTDGSAPRHAEHPDVIAARLVLQGLAAARLTDQHGERDQLTEEERQVRGYVIEPRGQGRVALYWMENGETVRRDTRQHGPALDILADRMRGQGWSIEPLRRSSACVFVHTPQEQPQGGHAAREVAAAQAPATTRAVAPAATPADVVRHDDVKVLPDGRGKWTVERGADFLGTIWDEGSRMSRGQYAAWSPYLPAAGFFTTPAAAVDAIVDAWPPSLADLAKETGAPLDTVAALAAQLAEEQEAAGQRVYRTATRGAAARVSFEAAAWIREALGAPAARYAVAIGSDEDTWPRFHGRDRAVRHAASYGLTADAVRDCAPAATR